jgi:LemA protein
LAVVVLLCWCVGAASRLLRLRAAVARAFAALALVLQRRLTWVQERTLAPQSQVGQRLAAARSQCALALEQASKRPLDAARIQSLALAGNALDAVWAAAEQAPPPDAKSDTKPDAGGLTWDALRHQALPLQITFNDQVARHNRAVTLFPASVLAFVLRFKPAAPLPVAQGGE